MLRWAERHAGRGYRVVRTRRLTGGVETATHQLTLQRATGRGEPLQLVLRRAQPWAAKETPEWSARLAEILGHVAAYAPGLPAPEAIAAEPEAFLMRKLPGRIELAPKDPSSWLQQVADALRTIHSIPPTGTNELQGRFGLRQ